jgi:hypothetical protein
MRPRLPIRRILFLRPFRPPNSPRPFTQNTLTSRSRPQLPFLSTSNRRPIARFLTTERKQWIKNETWQAVRYTGYLWTFSILSLVIAFGVQQEWLERKFPTPDDWSFVTRKDFRSARWDEDHDSDTTGPPLVDWARTGGSYRRLLGRLEDPNLDGAGLQEQGDDEGGILVAGVGKTGSDISAKSEPWRRGYFEVLMGCARAAEHLDGWVRDKIRNVAFPGNVVIGPSNPNPRPVPPNAKSPPNEEDCEAAFEAPEVFYLRALTTKGFTEKQKLEAALAYANWLDYKGTPGAAEEMYKWALDIVTKSSVDKSVVKKDGTINANSQAPSSNVLDATTALAIHYASNSNLQAALPIFVSILRARRQLDEPPKTMRSTLNTVEDDGGWMKTLSATIGSLMAPPPYPPPPPDGTSPPHRDAKERCEEAGIMVYIGEIMFAAKSSKTSREDGLAWTREAVDVAEEELRRVSGSQQATRKNPLPNEEARETCKQCLEVGLSNWNTMVSRLAREEKATKLSNNSTSWLGFGGNNEATIGRWESEEAVVKERMRRAAELVSINAPSPAVGISSVLTA